MLIHIGFGNIVNTSKIIAIVSPESAPIKRLVQNGHGEQSGGLVRVAAGNHCRPCPSGAGDGESGRRIIIMFQINFHLLIHFVINGDNLWKKREY